MFQALWFVLHNYNEVIPITGNPWRGLSVRGRKEQVTTWTCSGWLFSWWSAPSWACPGTWPPPSSPSHTSTVWRWRRKRRLPGSSPSSWAWGETTATGRSAALADSCPFQHSGVIVVKQKERDLVWFFSGVFSSGQTFLYFCSLVFPSFPRRPTEVLDVSAVSWTNKLEARPAPLRRTGTSYRQPCWLSWTTSKRPQTQYHF